MKSYELWLDESGSFQPVEQKNAKLNPSLIGGVLIEQGMISDPELQSLTCESGTEGFAHATDYSKDQAIRVQLNALKTLCEKGAHLVYFENKERVDHLTNRELYLRLMAKGLVELMRVIGQSGEFRLDIYIARRMDANPDDGEISADEYSSKLKDYITEDRKRGQLDFEENCVVNFAILSARRESRLALADFASNARLTRDSAKFNSVRQDLYSLFEDDYIFSFSGIKTSMSRIKSKLAAGNIADALMELYTGYGELDHNVALAQIMDRFEYLSYRLQRLNLSSFTSLMVAYIRSETEFERSEAVGKHVIRELSHEFGKRHIQVQTDDFFFRMHAWLLDMLLREGDILQARKELEAMEEIVKKMGYRMENLAYLWLWNDRKALFEINCMEYEKAVKTTEHTIRTMEQLIGKITEDPFISSVFGETDMTSEYLGDSYCMKVYAEMFLQRENKELYERYLKNDTERALSQYRYEGELERNRQYRAHVEMEQGNYEEAMKWLLSTKNIDYEPNKRIADCCRYLEDAGKEDRLSRNYYVMYYVELMYEAQRAGKRAFSDDLFEALQNTVGIYGEFFITTTSDIHSDYLAYPMIQENVLEDILGVTTRLYHPLEIVRWKYGLFLFDRDYNESNAQNVMQKVLKWLDLAEDVCGDNTDYLGMQIIALAIQLDKTACFLANKNPYKGMRARYQRTRKKIREETVRILKIRNLPEKLRDFVHDVQKKEQQIPDEWKEAISFREEFSALARRIAY